MATNTHIQRGPRRRIALLLVLVTAGGISGSAVGTGASSARVAAQGYNWPIKPFGRAHPVRATLGDPRTTFFGPPSMRSLMRSRGDFHIHGGVDISAPDGTAVYPVRSGVAKIRNGQAVRILGDDGSTFEYWHLVLSVRNGQHVTAYSTVLGRISKGHEHVHLYEYGNTGPLNPLARGHLRPYSDRTKPHVSSISFRDAAHTSTTLLPEMLRGRVRIVSDAYDMPSLRVPGKWRDLPVAPALVEWKVVRADNGKVAVPSTVGFDARERAPQGRFWEIYARGTRQNMAPFGGTRAYFQPGVYLYHLGVLDTRRLDDDVYRLVVTARDIRGNGGSLTQIFSVRNHHRWPTR